MELRTKTNWGAVLVAFMAGILAAAHYGKVPPALPNIRAEIPLTLIVSGWIMSIFSGTGSILAVATGTLADRIGAKRFCLLGLGGVSLGALLGGYATSGEMLLLSRFLEGLGFISVAVSTPILIIRSTAPKDLQLSLGVWTTYMPGGMALAMLVLPYLLTLYPWRTVWVSIAVLSLVWALVIFLVFEKDDFGTPEEKKERLSFWDNLRLTLACPGPWLLSLSFAFYTVQWISIMAWLPSFMVQERGLDLKTVGFLTAIIVASNIPGNLTSSYLIKRGIARSTTLWISAIGMGITVYMIFDPSLTDFVRFSACLVFSYFGGMLPGAVLSSAPVVAPTPGQLGTVNGMMVQGSHLGQMAGPPIVAAIVTATGDWGDAKWLLIASSVGVALLAYLFRRIELK
ncbi:MAG: MFS transporter [Alphaproteobacteria bacterium]|nr:MFS transporter [Rhodospirillales bacterium]MCW9045987.1 MFS transporter [Alphaproteobacteria bacterium]